MYNNLPETLDIPEQPEEVSPELLEDDPLPPLPKEVHTYEEKRTLSLFGELMVQIGGQACSPILIKDPVQQELLAFITSESRYKDLKRDDILNEIYEAHYPNDNTDQLRDKLYKDAFVLRKCFKEASLQAGLPYINPFPVPRGSNAIWQLDSAYTVLDLAYLTQVRTQWEAIKKGGLEDIGRFRNIWDEAQRLYIKGFLTRLVQIGAIGKWAKNRYRQYREEYKQLTLEIADYEKTLGERLSGEEQRLCFRHSAQMYKDYAFATMPLKKEELERGGQTHLSEHALQYCITMFTQSGDKESSKPYLL